jgi:hypothetical protein
MPAEAGIQNGTITENEMDSRLRGNDDNEKT